MCELYLILYFVLGKNLDGDKDVYRATKDDQDGGQIFNLPSLTFNDNVESAYCSCRKIINK